jgi:4-hydroxy-tetrahydrodipicolinate synthase
MDDRFRGLGVALITPFRSNGQIDYAGLEKLIDHQIAGGVDYVVSMGTTGESVTLTKAEKHELLAQTIGFVRNRVPVVLEWAAATLPRWSKRSTVSRWTAWMPSSA